jgi:phage shock protein PspC (stress-responsive transcriptional regulator)
MGGLTRSNDDVVISGLCGGLGRQFGIDPLVFRIAFVVMALAGGTGILLYLVGWALVPDDTGSTFGARWLPGSDRGHKLLAAGLAGIGLLLLIDQIFDGHGDDMPLGLVLVGLGAAVLWSRRGGRTLTPPPSGGWSPTGPVPTSPPPPPPPTPTPAPTAGEGEPRPPNAEAQAEPGSDRPDDVVQPLTDEAVSESNLTTPPPAGSSAWAETTASTVQVPPAPPVDAPTVRTAARPPKPPKPPKERSALVAVTLSLLAILAGVVTLAGLDLVTGLALALALVAGAMIVGAWRGRARGLIPIALLLSSVLFVASLIDVPFKGGAGERLYVPISVEEVRSPYRLVAGELQLDLRRVDLTGRTLPVVASMATGNIVVTVPDGVAVEVRAQVGAGDLLVFGRDWAGVGIDERVVRNGPEGAGRLRLDLHVGFGQLEVRRAPA